MSNQEWSFQSASQLKERFSSLVHHEYLHTYIDDTCPDEEELWLTYSIFLKGTSIERASAITLAAGFVHAGLDIHARVSLHNSEDDASRKKRQLNVLAGDFYSALYYQSLASVNAVDMIELYGSTIQEIHEQKMSVYVSEQRPFAEALEIARGIDAMLVQNIAATLGQWEYNELLADFFLFKRMVEEEKQWREGTHFPLVEVVLTEGDEDRAWRVWQMAKGKLIEVLERHADAYPELAPTINSSIGRRKTEAKLTLEEGRLG
ncbi:heptaprenyl diphosphate synthase component 1 [Shouchella shacheensis]|uniref:heptaprenyl diphosphate synthase component 1 n=1 Tax=Shouchella shacheensis TaxID=1649580 RepID=UPI0015D655C2|nr:heptaprenyl diphosphate synthase component 1 [Shouchella shacheensis]